MNSPGSAKSIQAQHHASRQHPRQRASRTMRHGNLISRFASASTTTQTRSDPPSQRGFTIHCRPTRTHRGRRPVDRQLLAVARQWLRTNQHRFARCLLLQHTENGGLAAARNTAFHAAKSSWCFVLDADNQLQAKAVEHCGALTTSADPQCGVIYPLIKVLNQHGSQDPRPLVSDLPWNPSLLAQANYIDAMALVRVEAWRQVGGYTHIPGGWEDYDFWCKLVDAEWHGLHCPQVLATYTSHLQSMRATSTNRKERQLRRLLQQRHPWLKLLTQEDAVVWPPQLRPTPRPGRPSQRKVDWMRRQVRTKSRISVDPGLPLRRNCCSESPPQPVNRAKDHHRGVPSQPSATRQQGETKRPEAALSRKPRSTHQWGAITGSGSNPPAPITAWRESNSAVGGSTEKS